ncbi:MAG: hypothetical protein ACLFP1_04685 [Candidatus Goldiibacteriota bacterium]
MAVKCPRCSELSKDGSDSCWSCGAVFASGEKSTAEDAPVKKTEEKTAGKNTKKTERITLDEHIKNFFSLVKQKYFSGSGEKKLLGGGGLFVFFVSLFGLAAAVVMREAAGRQAPAFGWPDLISVFFYIFFFATAIIRIFNTGNTGLQKIYSVIIIIIFIMASGYVVSPENNIYRKTLEFIFTALWVALMWFYKEDSAEEK